MRKGNETEDIEILIDNLKWLEGEMPKALKGWMDTRPACDAYPNLTKRMCQNPKLVKEQILDPVIKWLYDYQLKKESGKLDRTFILLGLRKIYDFIFFAEFLSKNTDFFTGQNKGGKPEDLFALYKKRQQYRNILNAISERLIGCRDTLSFIFLRLSEGIPLNEDMKKIRDYLHNRCVFLKYESLQ